MLPVDWRLLAMLVAALAALQAVCWLLARGLALRLGRGAVLAGLLLPLALLAPWLTPSLVLAPCDILRGPIPDAPPVGDPERHALLNDAIYQFLPWELEVRHALGAGRLPFWSDLLEGGSSPWMNPQAGVLSPLAMLARPFPLQHHLLAMLAFKLLVACQGTWLLARRTGASRPAALVAGAGFALGGGVMSWALFPHTAAVAWAPWLAVATIELFRPRPALPRGGALALAALLAAALLLSGHPETAAVAGLFAGLCGLGLARRGRRARGLGAALAAAGLAFALAAVHLLPFLWLLPRSQRAHETLAAELPPHDAELGEPSTWFLPGHHRFVLAPTNPHAFGRPYRDPFTGPINQADAGSGYAGLAALAGAVAALGAAATGRLRRAVPFLLFAALALLLAARFLPLAVTLHAVPPLRAPAWARFLLVGCLALAVAGALGLDRLLGLLGVRGAVSGDRRARLARVAALAGFGVAAALSLAVRADALVVAVWSLLAAAVLLGLAATRQAWSPRAAARLRSMAVAGVALALGLDLLPWSRSVLPRGHPELFYPRTEFTAALAREAGDPAVHRAVGGSYLVYPALLAVYGLADPRPHNPMAPMDQLRVLGAAFGFRPSTTTYFAPFGGLGHPLLDFLGVRAVVGSPGVPRTPGHETVDGGRFRPFRIDRNPDPLPRWFLASAVEAIDRRDLEAWIVRLDDPGRVAVWADEAGPRFPAGAAGGPIPARPLAVVPGRVALELPPGPPGADRLLATSLPLPEGWRASTAGRRLPTLTANGAFLGVRVPADAIRVELRFVPPGFWPGLALSLAGVVGTGTLLRRRGQRPPRSQRAGAVSRRPSRQAREA